MANQYTSSSPQAGMQQGSTQASTTQGRASPQGQGGVETGTRDATYNLISVVYHALQGAETYKMYEEDVERTEDDELASFFRQCHEDEKRRAQRGKELLTRHLQKSAGSGQQLQSGSASKQQGSGANPGSNPQQGSGSRSSQQSGGSSNQQTQAVPGDQYGNTQSTSAGKGDAAGGGGSRSR